MNANGGLRPLADAMILVDRVEMDREPPTQKSSWLRRIGLLAILAGSTAIMAYGRTPYAVLSIIGVVVVLAEPYLMRRPTGS
jgi:uncharacterized membrane protein HdeD (DUF308 family)